jgi:ABC-type phosphate transport system permease subunit
MNDHETEQAICALIAMSAVFAVVWVVGILVQLHTEGSELLSWNSWLEYFSSWSGV